MYVCLYACLPVCMYVVVCVVCIHGEHHAPATAMSGIYCAPGWPPKMLGCWHGAGGPGSVVALLPGKTSLALGLPSPVRGRVASVAHPVAEEGQVGVQ